MESLTTDPVAAVLKRLFQEAEIADRPLLEDFRNSEKIPDLWTKVIEEKARDYRTLYRKFTNNFLNVSAEFGASFICMRARAELNRSLNSAHPSASQPSTSPARLATTAVAG